MTKLKALEDKSGIQLVVATVKSLEGNDIAPYANALFREWKLGEAGKNNGVLLLVAPNERKVRIEVGYGLEGRLTDAVTKIIIINFIAPSFKVGDYAGGIARGVDGLINTLTEDAAEWHGKAKRAPLTFTDLLLALTPLVIFGGIFYVIWRLVSNGARHGAAALQKRRGKYKNSSGKWVRDDAPYVASSSSSGSSSWSSSSSSSSSSTSSDSFSGGGGSSGGGGASGDW